MLTRKILSVALLLHVVSVACAHGGHWQSSVIATVDNTVLWPMVSDGRVAWRQGMGTQAEIFVYENGIVNQLTDNQIAEELIGIAGDYVAWSQSVRVGYQEQVKLVVNGDVVAEGLPYVSDARLEREGLAWGNPHSEAGSSEIYFYDGESIHTLVVDGTSSNHNPDISGSRVVWSGFDDNVNHAYMYDGQAITKLPAGVGIGQVPQIDGDYVTGILVDDENYISGVTRYNIASGQLETFPSEIRFTTTPYISAKQMAWVVHINETSELIALDSQQMPVQLTTGGFDTGPFVTDSFVAWSQQGDQSGIFVFTNDRTFRIVDAGPTSYLTGADNDSLVWLRSNGTSFEIVLATIITPEPNGLTIVGIALISCIAWCRRRQTCTNSCPDTKKPFDVFAEGL